MIRAINYNKISVRVLPLLILSLLIFTAKSQTVTADFTVSDQDCETVQFQDQSVAVGWNITGYLWDFGDGNSSTIQNPLHVYVGELDYNVTLTVFHDGPGQSSVSKQVSVWIPVANFMTSATCVGELIDFTSTSTTPTNSILTNWQWDFDNDGTFDASGENASFTYSLTGPQLVLLQVTNDLGCTHTISKIIQIQDSPLPDFTSDTVCFGHTTQFTNLSTTPVGTITDYRWDFDNDGMYDEFIAEPSYTFPGPGIFPVTLEVENNQGCSASITKDVKVYGLPVASYSYDQNCPLEETQFTDLSLPGEGVIDEWQWDYDDGTLPDNVQNPIHIFTLSGIYSVNLLIEDEYGCQDDTTVIIPQQKPDAGFQVDSVCLNFPSLFDDTSTYQSIFFIDSWQWDFGEGGSASVQDPSYTYADHGVYEVELVVGNALLCYDTATRFVLVDTLPVAAFSYDPACEGLQTCFTDESIVNADTLVSWEWDFGDGSISTLNDPCHIYMSGGNFDVTLTVINSDGCVSEPYTETIFVSKAPDANFSFGDVCFGDTTFFLNLTDTFGYQVSYWFWYFDDTASVNNNSSLMHPNHFFTGPGSYNVLLKVENEYGCIDSITQLVVVDSIPEANFSMVDTISVGIQFTITDLSIPHGSPILTKYWEFGDGSNATNINPVTHFYSSPGKYQVCLTVEDVNGCSNQFCDSIVVVGKPQADFNYASDITLETFFFDESFPESSIIDWYWDFGDPATTLDTISGVTEPMWQYTEEGWYSVFLEVEDKFGGFHDTIKLIYAGNAVIADFEQFGQCLGDTTFFVDNSYSPLSSGFEEWYWNFGDGTDTTYYEKIDTISHHYAGPGNYQVKFGLSATVNGFFMTDTLFKTVSVFEYPSAKVDTSGLGVCFGTPIQFQDATIALVDTIESWIWDFDTPLGDSAFVQNPSFIYADTGDYNVKMTVISKHGCSSLDSVDAHVNYAPNFGFIVENNCINSPALFIPQYDDETITITSWNWDFGDISDSLNTSTDPMPTHIYDRIKNYKVTMKMDAYDCPGEYSRTILVYPIPYSQFTTAPNYDGVQGRTKFTNNSIYATSYLWDFGNGNTSGVPDPIEVYEADSTYTITLVSYNAYNCSDTSRTELTVFFTGLYFPTAFSPGNPNKEVSLFTPKGVNLSEYLVQVFDMRGNLLWESKELNEAGIPVESWDGYYDGRLMPQGLYIWKAEGKFKDGSVWKGQSYTNATPQTNGTVTLIR